jgi:hypothetical protein
MILSLRTTKFHIGNQYDLLAQFYNFLYGHHTQNYFHYFPVLLLTFISVPLNSKFMDSLKFRFVHMAKVDFENI